MKVLSVAQMPSLQYTKDEVKVRDKNNYKANSLKMTSLKNSEIFLMNNLL